MLNIFKKKKEPLKPAALLTVMSRSVVDATDVKMAIGDRLFLYNPEDPKHEKPFLSVTITGKKDDAVLVTITGNPEPEKIV